MYYRYITLLSEDELAMSECTATAVLESPTNEQIQIEGVKTISTLTDGSISIERIGKDDLEYGWDWKIRDLEVDEEGSQSNEQLMNIEEGDVVEYIDKNHNDPGIVHQTCRGEVSSIDRENERIIVKTIPNHNSIELTFNDIQNTEINE